MTFLEKIVNAKILISDAIKKYPNIIVGCSFGKDSMVMLHLVLSIKKDIPIFSVLANTEFKETYRFIADLIDDWKLNCKIYSFEQLESFKEDLSLCCSAPKIEATKKALKDYDVWISGVRKTEGITRSDFEETEKKGNIIKINPILNFTELDIWRYTALNKLPINPKYQEGFRSLGCQFCSFPEIDEKESERAGRWKGTDKVCGECGIHTEILK